MAFARIPTGRYVSVSCMTSKWLIAGAEFVLSSFYLVLTLVEEQINSKPVPPGASNSLNTYSLQKQSGYYYSMLKNGTYRTKRQFRSLKHNFVLNMYFT